MMIPSIFTKNLLKKLYNIYKNDTFTYNLINFDGYKIKWWVQNGVKCIHLYNLEQEIDLTFINTKNDIDLQFWTINIYNI